MSVSQTWGTQPAERRLRFPCDLHAAGAAHAYYRGVSIDAPAGVVFRWLCQLRVAPYSYDWIDNWGRRSPQVLIDGLEDLERGQEIMRIFELVDFEPERHLTIRTKARGRSTRHFGDVIVSYLIVPASSMHCRLLAKLLVQYPRGGLGQLMRLFLPWGDLIMMRRQLLNLKRLAEADPPTSFPR